MGTQRPNQLQTAMSMAHLLHPLTSREKMLMVLASHATENRGGASPQGWAVAGLLAGQTEWERFEQKWRKLPVPEPAGGLRAWQVAGLFGSLAEGELLGIGCAISAAAFASIPIDERKRRLWGNSDNPQLSCFQHCVTDAVRRLTGLPEEESVCFLMDCGDAMAAAALWFYEDLKNFSPEPARRRLGALGVESKRDFPLLQAAEALAAECCKELRIPAEGRVDGSRSNRPHLHFTVLDGPRPLSQFQHSLQVSSPHGPGR